MFNVLWNKRIKSHLYLKLNAIVFPEQNKPTALMERVRLYKFCTLQRKDISEMSFIQLFYYFFMVFYMINN